MNPSDLYLLERFVIDYYDAYPHSDGLLRCVPGGYTLLEKEGREVTQDLLVNNINSYYKTKTEEGQRKMATVIRTSFYDILMRVWSMTDDHCVYKEDV